MYTIKPQRGCEKFNVFTQAIFNAIFVAVSNAIFVALELAMKEASVNLWWFCCCSIPEVLKMIETSVCNVAATKSLLVYILQFRTIFVTSSSATKVALERVTKITSKIAYVNSLNRGSLTKKIICYRRDSLYTAVPLCSDFTSNFFSELLFKRFHYCQASSCFVRFWRNCSNKGCSFPWAIFR